jgi:YbbR domain-containing protein
MLSTIRQIFFNNFRYKIAALFLASLLWYIVQGEEILEINRKIRVHLQPPPGFLVKGGPVRYKDVTLSGPRVLLGDFSSDYVDAYIPISITQPTNLRFRIDKEFIRNWNNKIKLTVHDAYISIEVDVKSQKSVAIKENIHGIPAEGFLLEKTTVTPPKVIVTGLKSDLKNVNQILTEPIDITNLQKTKNFDVKLFFGNNPDIQVHADKISVLLQIGDKKINKFFDSIPIEVNGSDFLTRVIPQKVSITVQGTTEVLNFITEHDFKAFLDVSDLAPGTYQRKVQIKIPPDTILVETNPEATTIEIYSKKKKL